MKDRNILFNNWILRVIKERPDIISPKTGRNSFYSEIKGEFLKDYQLFVDETEKVVLADKKIKERQG